MLLVVALLSPAMAQTQSEVRAKRVIDDAIAALGGQKFLTMEDRVETGRGYSFYRGEVTGLDIAKISTRYVTVAEGKTGEELSMRERQSFGKNGDYGLLFREDGAWEISYRGSMPLAKDRAERYKDTALRDIFYILRIRLHEPGLIFESRGLDVIENQPVEVVDITDSQNRVVTVYFHQSTKLPVQQKWSFRDPLTKDRDEEVTRFSRYREENGIQWPHQVMRERNRSKTYEMFAESVVINQDLTDSIFAVPDAVAPRSKTVPKKK